MEAQKMAAVFKALSDENRIRILQVLKNGEYCAGQLLEGLNITQPTLSHHMNVLCEAEIVTGRKEGKWTYYSISGNGVCGIKSMLHELLPDKGAVNG